MPEAGDRQNCREAL